MLDVAPEVREALASGRAVVALESTIVAHGFPWPQNLVLARALEVAVREAGAIPATIAVVAGRACVGLADAQLERLARDAGAFVKVGAADLAVSMAAGGDAATTVSATAFLAARAGIRVFATGGIGGVHRGEEGDVSSDLTTLAREPVAVVSAGAKAILDLPRTAELLETLGVLVLGYGVDEMPAFYTRRSGVHLHHRVESAAQVAAICRVRWASLEQGGVLVCNPIPVEAALDEERVAGVVAAALSKAAAHGVRGKALTPYLLAELASATGGASVEANRALALANARLAAEIAVAL